MSCIPGGKCCYSMSSCSDLECAAHGFGPHCIPGFDYTDTEGSSFFHSLVEKEIDVDENSGCYLRNREHSSLYTSGSSISGEYVRFPSVTRDVRPVPTSRTRHVFYPDSSEADDDDSGYFIPSASTGISSSRSSEIYHESMPAPENSPTSGYRESYGMDTASGYRSSSSESGWHAASPARFCLLHLNSDSPCSVTTGRRSSSSGSEFSRQRQDMHGRSRHTGRENTRQRTPGENTRYIAPGENTYIEPVGVRPPCIGQEQSPAAPRLPPRPVLPPPRAVRDASSLRPDLMPTADPHNRVSAWLADIPEEVSTNHTVPDYQLDGTLLDKHYDGYMRMSSRRQSKRRFSSSDSSVSTEDAMTGRQHSRSEQPRPKYSKASNPTKFDMTVASDATAFMQKPLCRPSVTKRFTPAKRRTLAKRLKEMCKQINRKTLDTLAVL